MAKVKPDDDATPDDPDDADGLPTLSKSELAEIARAARITPDDLDAAQAVWERYAGPEMSGLWDADTRDEA